MRKAKADAISAISRMKSDMPTITPLPVSMNDKNDSKRYDDPKRTTTNKDIMMMTPTSTAATVTTTTNHHNHDAVFKTPNGIESKLVSSSSSSSSSRTSSSKRSLSSSKKRTTPQRASPFQYQQNSKSTAVLLARIPFNTTDDVSKDTPFGNVTRVNVVSYIHVRPTSTFGLRLLALVHQSHIESPNVCRWVDSGRSVEIRSKHPELKSLLLQYFQRTLLKTSSVTKSVYQIFFTSLQKSIFIHLTFFLLLFSFSSSDSKFLSLQRQLNNYGFQNQSGCSAAAAAAAAAKDNDYEHGRIVYAHPDFHQQSDPTLIETLLRVKSPKNGGSSSETLRSTRTPTSSSSRTRKSTPVAVASMEVVRSDHVASTIVVTKTEAKSATPPPPLPEPTLPMSSSVASMKTSPTTSKKKGPTKSSLKNKRPSFLVSTNNVAQKENLVPSKGNYKRLKVTFEQDDTEDDQLRDKMSTPEHSSMISTFLSTPLFQRSNTYGYEPWAPNKMHHTASSSSSSSSSSSPSVCMAGLRVLFHCSPRAVKYSPLVPVQCPPSSPSSPMMSMVDMDLDCFEKAMDALSPPHHHH
jgi:hypothetical protein